MGAVNGVVLPTLELAETLAENMNEYYEEERVAAVANPLNEGDAIFLVPPLPEEQKRWRVGYSGMTAEHVRLALDAATIEAALQQCGAKYFGNLGENPTELLVAAPGVDLDPWPSDEQTRESWGT